MPLDPLARAPYERHTIQTPTWDQWLTKLVTKVNDLAAGGGTYDAGNLTGTTLAANVVNSSLTGVGTLTSGATGAGFTLNFGTSTMAGVVPVTNGGTGNSSLTVNRIPYGNGTSPFQSDADLTFDGSTLTLNGLLNLSGAAAGQIQFPATANPSSNANTLDEYEEGAWTAVDNSGAGLTFNVINAGIYVKTGRDVQAAVFIRYPVTASGAQAKIGGLPFTCAATPGAGIVGYCDATVVVNLYVAENTTEVRPVVAPGAALMTNTQLSNRFLAFVAVYQASA